MIKALFFNFYGTIVHEDSVVIDENSIYSMDIA